MLGLPSLSLSDLDCSVLELSKFGLFALVLSVVKLFAVDLSA